jgi:hypothetical protein
MVAFPDMQVLMDDLRLQDEKVAASLGHFDQSEYERQLEHGVSGS